MSVLAADEELTGETSGSGVSAKALGRHLRTGVDGRERLALTRWPQLWLEREWSAPGSAWCSPGSCPGI